MKGTPRSVLLTWANRYAGWWTSAAVSMLQKQQRAWLRQATPSSKTAKPKRRRRRK